jgi:hypothetical protein
MNRLVFLERLRRLVEFYIPNMAALQKSMAGPRMGREAWLQHFRKMRVENPKPVEKLTGVAMRLPNSEVRTTGMLSGHQALYRRAGGQIRGVKSRHQPVKGIAAVRLVETDPAWGFRTTQQPFVTRHEAKQIARKYHKLKGRIVGGLHSSDMAEAFTS